MCQASMRPLLNRVERPEGVALIPETTELAVKDPSFFFFLARTQLMKMFELFVYCSPPNSTTWENFALISGYAHGLLTAADATDLQFSLILK